MGLILLEVVTPQKLVFRREVDEVTVPGLMGEFGIMPQHTPFLTTLGTGTLRTIRGKDVRKYVISGGFAEVSDDHVIVLTESCEASDEVDLARAKRALDAAEKAMMEGNGSPEESDQIFERAKRARARIEVAEGRDF